MKEHLVVLRYLDEAFKSAERPRVWGDCDTIRKCPWVGCRYHLGKVELWHGKHIRETAEVDKMSHSCALQVAAEGPHSLQEIAEIMQVTPEHVRQGQVAALEKLALALGGDDAE